MLFVVKMLIGMLVGTLVGLTGLGGGVLLLPILIFGLGVSPIVAVGSDAAFNALTKIGAGYLHWKWRTLDRRLVGGLCVGSIPGALGGVLLIRHLRIVYGNEFDGMLRNRIGFRFSRRDELSRIRHHCHVDAGSFCAERSRDAGGYRYRACGHPHGVHERVLFSAWRSGHHAADPLAYRFRAGSAARRTTGNGDSIAVAEARALRYANRRRSEDAVDLGTRE